MSKKKKSILKGNPKLKGYYPKKERNQERKSQKRMDCSAMITVEAAFVIPILFFILLAILNVGFYYMDQSRIYSVCDLVVSHASISIENQGNLKSGEYSFGERNNTLYDVNTKNVETEITSLVEEECKNKLLLIAVQTIETNVSGSDITVKVKSTTTNALWQFLKLPSLSFQWTKKGERGNAPSFVRKTEVAKDLVKDWKEDTNETDHQ